jgi:ATP-dependent DNA helicase RecQ
LQPREDDNAIHRISHYIKQQNNLKYQQVHAVIDYIENDSTCKSIQLLSYFGEKNLILCGICSVCITKNKKADKLEIHTLKSTILMLLEKNDFSSRDLIKQLDCTETELKQTLILLLEHGLISLTNKNTYKLST